MTGTAGQKRLPTGYFATRAFPLPPLAEQQRIVAKVDELMALCDKLEAQQREREALCKLMGDSVFAVLGQAKIRTEIQDAWQRIQDNVSVVLADPFNVQNYRTALLDLAVSGLLLEDRENHESTGFMLLKQIAKRRDEWSKNSEGQEH